MDHLFVNCEVSTITWNAIFKWLDIQLNSFDCINGLFDLIDAIRKNVNKRMVINVMINSLFGNYGDFVTIQFLEVER